MGKQCGVHIQQNAIQRKERGDGARHGTDELQTHFGQNRERNQMSKATGYNSPFSPIIQNRQTHGDRKQIGAER